MLLVLWVVSRRVSKVCKLRLASMLQLHQIVIAMIEPLGSSTISIANEGPHVDVDNIDGSG